MPRILYHAWILHYRKKLDVHVRPPPLPVGPEFAAQGPKGAGLKWLEEGALEALAKRRLETFLSRRSREMDMEIVLVPGDPSAPRLVFGQGKEMRLSIKYLSPSFFTLLFVAPSAHHVLLLCTEKIYTVSDASLFLRVFETPSTRNRLSATQKLRLGPLPPNLLKITIPAEHPLDVGYSHLSSYFALRLLLLLDVVEKLAYSIAKARVVPGEEPWKMWQRAADALERTPNR
jgi:hypothetical protein